MKQWTPEMDETLARMRLDGHSSTYIGTALGTTKSAVIGRAFRLGLPRLPTGAAKKAGPEPWWLSTIKPQSAPRAPRLAAPAKIAPVRPIPKPVTLLARHPRQCSWIIGPVAGPQTMMCGASAVSRSWCVHHVDVGHQHRVPKPIEVAA